MPLQYKQSYIQQCFTAMASPCELLIDSPHEPLAQEITHLAVTEVHRIEQKYSRYRKDNLCYQINQSQGSSIAIDEETFRLFNFADQCYQLSEGLFDITSGVLRKLWDFRQPAQLPTPEAVQQRLANIGWPKVDFDSSSVTLPKKMQIDFGGIGKEYAVDKVTALLRDKYPDLSVLVNLGGDIGITCKKRDQSPWQVGIENPARQGTATQNLAIYSGALATSGNTYQSFEIAGKRYGHILNPKTGYPVENPPWSVTVAANNCLEAGMLATIAMLQGVDAEAMLEAQDINYWCHR